MHRILIVNRNDVRGGAGIAAHRLHKGLLAHGLESDMLVDKKFSDDQRVHGTVGTVNRLGRALVSRLDHLPVRMKSVGAPNPWSTNLLPTDTVRRINRFNADIVSLHWIGNGFLPVFSLRNIRAPIVWTLHDMWAFTGGCHYDGGCGQYLHECGRCPLLGSKRRTDMSRVILGAKRRAWADVQLSIVAPSRWLADRAHESSLFRRCNIYVIANGIDTNVFQPHSAVTARRILGLPQDKMLLLFGALQSTSDPRKGFKYLQSALYRLSKLIDAESVELVVFGASAPTNPELQPLPTRYIGRLTDETMLALAYSAADVFVAPSIEENLPNTIVESMACGTPCVAFGVGGVPEIISHQVDGYLAEPRNSYALATGMVWLLEEKARRTVFSRQARKKALSRFDLAGQSQKYATLFGEIADRSPVHHTA